MRNAQMPTVTVLQDFSKAEAIQLIAQKTGRQLSDRQFYQWLWAALIPGAKPLYNQRDMTKLLFVGKHLNRCRSLKAARVALIEAIKTQPEKFPQE